LSGCRKIYKTPYTLEGVCDSVSIKPIDPYVACMSTVILTLEQRFVKLVHIYLLFLRTQYHPLQRPLLADFLPQDSIASLTTVTCKIPAFNMLAFHIANINIDSEAIAEPMELSL
jgi:hypothetical protein